MTWAEADAGADGLDYVAQIRAEVRAMAAILREHGRAAAVEACPGWDVGDVVGHLGEVHRWATEIVRTGEPCDREGTPPSEVDEHLPWFESGADALCRTLEDTDPERACWTFGFPPARAGLWRRRQVFETAVHHFDIADATGTSFELSPAMASRGVAEVTTFMFPRQVAMGRTPPLASPVDLRVTDTGEVWRLGDAGDPQAEIAGAATALLLMIWQRRHGPLERTGDQAALAAFDAARLTP